MKSGKQTWEFSTVFLQSVGTAVGPKEAEGPFGDSFDVTYSNLHCDQDNWELAERKLLEDAVESCLSKKELNPNDVDIFVAGDLLNQIVSATYTARTNQIPFLGVFGACSTSMESLAIASSLVEGGFANKAIAGVSSHNATAERQFRYPTEYGGQKPGTATSTVTGAGAALISQEPSDIRISAATIGRVVDWGIKDPFDMGSAMAPAAADTLATHFTDLNIEPSAYDLIVTGDLSAVGAPIVRDLLSEKGFDITNNHNDCGLMIYRPDQKEVFAGGSGCACSAVVTYGHLIDLLKKGNYNKILVTATGCLHSPVMVQQKETMPAIAHAVVFERVGGVK
ncbi:stage V sporulation protein AD [Pseudalkalibacillus hwajinpoensis]|uniref:stage V sporulation protein AD n=1 Tax=Guptibacillus hwajinpoensis TaxID=208199 RepID=UPI001CD48284|nr:stage V sporulation protein AD [Pseudalkalibacillus hwajinpoensis]MCA0990851.1 stage V sporulation protein AD [Pseudalkalibacillus hwajinpoensis]